MSYKGGTPENKHPTLKNTPEDKPTKTRHHLKQTSTRKQELKNNIHHRPSSLLTPKRHPSK